MHLTLRPLLQTGVAIAAAATIAAASLGAASARDVEVGPGFNLVGGPRQAISPAQFLSCVEPADWFAIYVWDGESQTWLRYVNPDQVPDYVNEGPRALEELTPGAGITLLMHPDFDGGPITLAETAAEACTQ